MNPVSFHTKDVTRKCLETALLHLTEKQESGFLLSSNHFGPDPYGEWDLLAGIGVDNSIYIPAHHLTPLLLREMDAFTHDNHSWVFFSLSYDLRCVLENLQACNSDRIRFPELIMIRPQLVVGFKEHQCYAEGDPILLERLIVIVDQLREMDNDPVLDHPKINLRSDLTKQEYIHRLINIKKHIQQGDIYEMNFCREYYGALPQDFDTTRLYQNLMADSPAPFSAYCRFREHVLVSASPERFLRKKGSQLIAQPMKGTIRRGKDPIEDAMLKEQLQKDEKERAENVMIVDLIRNDLSKIAQKGSVHVEELFGVYTFPGVHQMISTVKAEIPINIPLSKVLKATFPMGSMTGAPKYRAMEIIENFEQSRRGIFSGAVGYIDPFGDFDMNVVIRSIVCDLSSGAVSFQTGGAITSGSDPEAELEETMLKAKALINALHGNLVE